jgi:hypothetical protein
MTFVCPKCGFKDSPCWRTSRFLIYCVYTTLDELKVWEPEVATKLENNVKIEDGPYFYWKRGRGNHVYRVSIELKDFAFGHNKTEKPKDPFQKKLIEVRG